MLCNGYVHMLIEEKLSLKEWMLVVARAFGPLHEMRDDPMGLEIPDEFPVDPYHKNGMEEAQRELELLALTTDEELVAKEVRRREERLQDCKKQIVISKNEHDTCANMLAEVIAWEAPEVLDGLKKYMISSLEEAVSRSMVTYYEEELARLQGPIDIANVRTHLVDYHQRCLEYHEKDWKTEVEGRETQREWLQALKREAGR